jgi:hypothetical protein
MDKICVIVKILIILSLILLFINLYRKSQEGKINLEAFADQQMLDYIKLNETYIEPDGTDLKLLYANYDGEESSPPQDIWTNKTLEQCVDLCNQLDDCKGFSRSANVADTAADDCHPRTKIGICHSVRKGNPSQMQNAIKYNSYIKTSPNSNKYKDVLTKCIGDSDLTLQRAVYIKSQMLPNKFIGTLGDGLALLLNKSTDDFDVKCKFRVEVGLDGIGTVSFRHINSNKYLYRMPAAIKPSQPTVDNITQAESVNSYEFIGLKDISNGGTEDKQRASFNILDAMKNRMKFQCMRVNGENVDKFIVINNDNQNYLLCKEIDSLPTEELYTFNIINSVITSNIINSIDKLSKNNNSSISSTTYPATTMPTNTMQMANDTMPTMPITTMPTNTMPTNTMQMANDTMTMPINTESNGKESFFVVDAIGNQIITQNTNPNLITASNLDTSNQLPLYNNIYNPSNKSNIGDYLSDNYGATQFNNYTSINKKASDIMIQKQLSKTLANNRDNYNSLNQLNIEIEREIAGLNMNLNAKNDKVINNVGRMQLSNMAKDYYTMKNAYSLAIQ